jgi:hypothetical protein
MAILFYEGGEMAYDSVKGYMNPKTGAIYGADPPTGWWRGPGDPKYSTSAATGAATSTNATATQGANTGTSMQVLSAEQVAMAKQLGYINPGNMSALQLVLVNNALADSAARTKAQQGATQSGSTTTTSATSTNAQAQSSGNTSAAGSTGAGFDLSKFMTDNKTMLLVAAAVAAFMMFSGGGESHRGRR